MSLPFEQYPVSAPVPSFESIFRKKIIIEEPKISSSKEILNDTKTKQPNVSENAKKNSRKKSFQMMADGTFATLKKKNLPLPPDINNLAPLEKARLKPSPVKVVKVKIPPKIIYEDIPMTAKLTREETVQVLKASVHDAIDEYKNWMLANTKFVAQQRANRAADLAKVRQEKEADKIANISRLETNQARRKAREAKLKEKKEAILNNESKPVDSEPIKKKKK
jgi:hypothetical protein